MIDDDYRPLRNWPEWMLRAVVTLRRRKSMWAEAYFELVERGADYAVEYAEEHGSAWPVDPPTSIS